MPWLNYYDGWETIIFECHSCGRKGTHEQADKGYYREFLDIMCSRCDFLNPPTIALILYPTIAEMRANIDKPGVREELERIDSFRLDSNGAKAPLDRI
jgi:hypothetical protein